MNNSPGKLVIANKELTQDTNNRPGAAVESIIDAGQLVFQSDEKEKRAAELIVAVKELVFQNEEKEKLATELIIAIKKLFEEKEEKEKHAAELIKANERLLLDKAEKEIRAAEALELKKANQELESFSYSVSHDLRGPLRAINGFTQILVEDYSNKLDTDGKDILHEIIANAKKMGDLIDNLLQFSRMGKQQVTMVSVNVKQLIDAAIEEVKLLYPGRKLHIKINNLANIKGDSSMLKQVFINLISNAVKYTGKKQNPVIEIGCYTENDFCTYYIKDNGAGFDMRYYDKLFAVFQRLHSSNEFEGTGVGLAIIQKVIAKHGGKVWAEGAVNKGASFYISLPILDHIKN